MVRVDIPEVVHYFVLR